MIGLEQRSDGPAEGPGLTERSDSPAERTLSMRTPPPFPVTRPRRLRRTPLLREMVREVTLDRRDLIAPLFVKEGIADPNPVSSLPGHFQHTLESLRKEAAELVGAGIPALLLFGIPADKDPEGTQAWASDGVIQRALRALRADLGDEVALIGDLCLCEYTDHGHCGLLDQRQGVDNDATLERYQRIAVAQAEAGADVIAPSGMMDGQVAAIRAALDAAGSSDTPIMAYAAKFASSMYGPFREAAEGAPRFGDRSGYQMDPANAAEAVREGLLDAAEGADLLMVKPALPYLDVLYRVKQETGLPMAAYQVSGEYALLKAAAGRGWVDGERAALETLTAIRRAGADLVITYLAREVAPLL
jgi:porphobilinogen synthase